jgi:hypothetical protein
MIKEIKVLSKFEERHLHIMKEFDVDEIIYRYTKRKYYEDVNTTTKNIGEYRPCNCTGKLFFHIDEWCCDNPKCIYKKTIEQKEIEMKRSNKIENNFDLIHKKLNETKESQFDKDMKKNNKGIKK